jgi:hypothetical protein
MDGQVQPIGSPTGASEVVIDTRPLRTAAEIARDERRARRRERKRRRLAADIASDERLLTELHHEDLTDPRGGVITPFTLVSEGRELHSRVRDEWAQGGDVHRRLPRLTRWIPPAVAVLDGLLLFYFMAGVVNVDLDAPALWPTTVAVTFAVFGATVAMGWLVLTGHGLKACRSARGGVTWGAVDALLAFELLVAAAAISAVAVLMFIRVRQDVVDALGPVPGSTAVLLAAVFAVLSGTANLCVLIVHARDGSTKTERLDELARTVRRHRRRVGRVLRRLERRRRRLDQLSPPPASGTHAE